MKNTLGIIISFDSANDLRDLTLHRPVASVQFGGRYRAIDFMLSNLVNSGCTNVGILMRDKYQSLMDHLGSGKDWDLARKNGGMMLLPPNAYATKSSPLVTENYRTSLEALGSVADMLNKSKTEHVLICRGDLIANIPLDDVLAAHKESGAEVTIVCKEDASQSPFDLFLSLDPNGAVVDMRNGDNYGGKCAYKSMGIYIMKRTYLIGLLSDCLTHNLRGLESEALPYLFRENAAMKGYVFHPYAAKLEDVKGYYDANMDMLDKCKRDQVFLKDRPIFTKVHDSTATVYGENCEMNDSLIADGCVIKGKVENSVIFRDVVIEEGAVVKNCILMEHTRVSADTELNYVIADKSVTFSKGASMSGRESYPIVIAKGEKV